MASLKKENHTSTSSNMTTVQLPQGLYHGLHLNGVNVFHGIPYAAPFQRFQPPAKPLHVYEEHNATSWGAVCPQLPSRLEAVMGPMPKDSGTQNEKKCGVLSIYVTTSEANPPKDLPVIVFVHGGAFLSGSSEISIYDGQRFARDAEAVVVTVNYRLGLFGFLPGEDDEHLSPGTLDAAAAFGWVRENIQHFGGDPKSVTGVGQSAGAVQVKNILEYFPELVDRVVLQSCPGGITFDFEKRRLVRKTVVENLPDGTTLDSATTEQLLVVQGKTLRALPGTIPPFWPNVKEDMIRESDKPKEILISWTKDDGNVFALLDGKDIKTHGPEITKSLFADPSHELGEKWRKQGHDVGFYEFTWSPEDFELGATHCIDLPKLLGYEEAWSKSPMIANATWDEWDRRGKEVRQAWGNFARNGTKPREVNGLECRD